MIVGYWPARKVLGTGPRRCEVCGREGEHKLIKHRKYLLILIPLIPLGPAHYHVECSECGDGFEIDRDQAEELVATKSD